MQINAVCCLPAQGGFHTAKAKKKTEDSVKKLEAFTVKKGYCIGMFSGHRKLHARPAHGQDSSLDFFGVHQLSPDHDHAMFKPVACPRLRICMYISSRCPCTLLCEAEVGDAGIIKLVADNAAA